MSVKYFIILALLCYATAAFAQARLTPQEKIDQAMLAIQKNYVDSISENLLAEAAVKGMITELDPHSKYFTKQEAESMQAAMRGSFVGVGVEYLLQNDTVYLTQILPDGPAQRAGLAPGDRVISIDGEKINGAHLSNIDILKKLRGAPKTTVNLSVFRPASGQSLNVPVIRGEVADHSITAAYMLNDTTGYIAIRIFSQSTRNEIEQALVRLKHDGMQNLILDLQGNGGGYVQAALGVADEFLKANQLVYYTVSQDKGRDYFYASATGTNWNGKTVVLIDQSTASASEILAGALQDWDRAVLVGRRTFGKGLTQRPVVLKDGSVLELTGGRLYTPVGRSVQKPYKGVDYQADIQKRYTDGELFGKTAPPRADSLAFKTLVSKRTVYAGGGITPDQFVPLDSLQDNNWLKIIAKSGMIQHEAWQISDNDRGGIKKKFGNIDAFIKGYRVPSKILLSIVKDSERRGWRQPSHDKKRLLDIIGLEIKAKVASHLYAGNEAYLRVINLENSSIQEALKIIQNNAVYAAYLKP